MGTGNASASSKMSASPVTSASARPASASSRNGRSKGVAALGDRRWGLRHGDGLTEGKIVVEKVLPLHAAQREFRIGKGLGVAKRYY